jgi:hypothetical protein
VIRDLAFLGHVAEDSQLSGASGAGAWAVVVFLAIIAAGLALLFYRYDEVER